MMKKLLVVITIMTLSGFFTDLSFGQDPVIFPTKGQTPEQMEKDKYDCYTWAKFDPMQAQPTAQAPPAQPQCPQGERIKGAVAGAAAATMVGGMKTRQNRRNQAQAQQQQAQQRAAATDQQLSTYNRAYSACLEGKGYTVK